MLDKFFEQLPIKDIYNDLFSSSFKKAGGTLSTLIGTTELLVLPLRMMNEKVKFRFEKHMKNYEENLNRIDDTVLCEVPEVIAAPIFNKLLLMDENELSNAFINLLTNASSKEHQDLAHPSFAYILENISVDEARMINFYKDAKSIPYINTYLKRYNNRTDIPDDVLNKDIKSREELELIFENNNARDSAAEIRWAWDLTYISHECELIFPDMIDLYIQNLVRLGILEHNLGIHFVKDTPIYDKIMGTPPYIKVMTSIDEARNENTNPLFVIENYDKYGFFSITDVGKHFIKACIREPATSR